MQSGGRIVGVAMAGVMAMALAVAGCSPVPQGTVPPVALTTPYPSSAAEAAATPAPEPTATPSPGATPAPAPSAIPGGWTYLGRRRCPDESEFECITLSVPRDHFTADGPSWDVEFAVRRATGTKVGTYVVITGGPGSSGISSADGYTGYYPASVPEHFDIVFLDQRGIGRSHPITCPDATAVYYASDVDRTAPAQAEAAGAVAKAYVGDCLAEAKADPADLPFYATRQAVEDLEAIREYLGVDTMHLYGESYGTQYVQTYATAHPDRIATLYLDGPVDLTLDGAAYYAEAARTFEDTLFATLNACEADATCAADLEGKDPVAAYEAIEADAADGGIAFDFPMGDGTTQARTLTAAGLENAAVGYLYAPTDRFLLLRALAAASDGDLVPLARLSYAAISVDPDTLEAVPDPTYSDALYYAVECQDYVYQADKATDEERLAGFLADGRTLGAADERFGGIYYDDMPCIYWPNRPASGERPAPIVDAPYPTVVLVATTDPITPVANAMRIANRLRNAHVVIQAGGPHVIFGWGLDCPDKPVADWMVTGKGLPAVLVCDGDVTDAYVALAKDAEADYRDGKDLMTSLVAQVLSTDDYVNELDEKPIRMGCDFGGVLTYTPGDSATGVALDACELTEGVPMTGSGSIDDETGAVVLDVAIAGDRLRYEGDGADKATVTGTFRGERVAP